MLSMEWTALENQVLQNRWKWVEMYFQDSVKKPCRMLTSLFAVLSPRFGPAVRSDTLILQNPSMPLGFMVKR
jgi:hypothetical protein